MCDQRSAQAWLFGIALATACGGPNSSTEPEPPHAKADGSVDVGTDEPDAPPIDPGLGLEILAEIESGYRTTATSASTFYYVKEDETIVIVPAARASATPVVMDIPMPTRWSDVMAASETGLAWHKDVVPTPERIWTANHDGTAVAEHPMTHLVDHLVMDGDRVFWVGRTTWGGPLLVGTFDSEGAEQVLGSLPTECRSDHPMLAQNEAHLYLTTECSDQGAVLRLPKGDPPLEAVLFHSWSLSAEWGFTEVVCADERDVYLAEKDGPGRRVVRLSPTGGAPTVMTGDATKAEACDEEFLYWVEARDEELDVKKIPRAGGASEVLDTFDLPPLPTEYPEVSEDDDWRRGARVLGVVAGRVVVSSWIDVSGEVSIAPQQVTYFSVPR
jgi:hypothetical protein